MKKSKRLRIFYAVLAGVVITCGLFYAFGIVGDLRELVLSGFRRAEWTHVEYSPDELRVFSVEDQGIGETDITFNESLFLINNDYPVSESRTFTLDNYKTTDVLMNRAMHEDYARLSAAVTEETGDNLYVMSSYRSFDEQWVLFEEDPKVAAEPGMSEHHSGLALDVYVYMFAGEGFLKSDAGKYVNEHCHEYGFIIRYPKGKEDITGYACEPWHIRYVGQPHARYMTLNHLTLEEYTQKFETGEFYLYDGYVISRQTGPELRVPEGATEITVSEDNAGCYMITAKSE